MTLIDLGAAPGGWSQVAARLVGHNGIVIASDILEIDPLPGVTFVHGDFREESVFQELITAIKDNPVDLVLSDMAPNMSGQDAVDQPRAMYLCELALDMAVKVLKPGGNFLVKTFQGEGYDAYRLAVKSHFKELITRKPAASRPRSREVYILAKGFTD